MPYGGFRSVSGQNERVRRQWEYFFADALEEQWPVSARQIPAPHALPEENIARNEQLIAGEVKTEASWAMTGHMKAIDPQSTNVIRPPLLQQKIGGAGFVLNIESVPLKKRPVFEHGNGIRMKGHTATMPELNFRGVHHMIEMPVGEQKPVNFVPGKIIIGSLWSVEKKVSRRCFEKVGIGVQRTTCKFFERYHRDLSRIMAKRRFDFYAHLCKFSIQQS